MLSNSTKRITLPTYIMMIPTAIAVTIKTASSAPRAASSAGSIPKDPGHPACGAGPGMARRLKPTRLQEFAPSSPASRPTKASLVHCAMRNGRNSCCLVCSTAGVIASTAEIGNVHLEWREGSAARY